MKLKQQTRLSILVIVLAALLLEANTALEFFSTRRSFNEQLTEKAQRDLNESHRIGPPSALRCLQWSGWPWRWTPTRCARPCAS